MTQVRAEVYSVLLLFFSRLLWVIYIDLKLFYVNKSGTFLISETFKNQRYILTIRKIAYQIFLSAVFNWAYFFRDYELLFWTLLILKHKTKIKSLTKGEGLETLSDCPCSEELLTLLTTSSSEEYEKSSSVSGISNISVTKLEKSSLSSEHLREISDSDSSETCNPQSLAFLDDVFTNSVFWSQEFDSFWSSWLF